MLSKLNRRQQLIAVALVLTFVAAYFAPNQERNIIEVTKSHALRTHQVNTNSSVNITDQDTLEPIGNRVWKTEKNHNLFPSKLKPPTPVKLVPQLQLPPTPTAPPLPFVYIGKVIEDGKPTIFISNQQKNYLLKGGEIIDGIYKVQKVESSRLVLTYLPLGTEQVMNIGGKD